MPFHKDFDPIETNCTNVTGNLRSICVDDNYQIDIQYDVQLIIQNSVDY